MAETVVTTLTDFLLARIAEDEANVPLLHDWAHGNTDAGWYGKREPVSRRAIVYGQTAARVLAECEAKRRIVDLHGVDHDCQMPSRYNQALLHAGNGFRPCPTLRALALPYADHPDFRQEWRV